MDTISSRDIRCPDLSIRNARLVNVASAEIQHVDIAVAEGVVVRVAPGGRGGEMLAREVFDADGSYLVPGFIDVHTHLELLLLSAAPFAEAVLPWGTTGIIQDMHEMINPMGVEGMRLLIEELRLTPLKAYLKVSRPERNGLSRNLGAVLKREGRFETRFPHLRCYRDAETQG